MSDLLIVRAQKHYLSFHYAKPLVPVSWLRRYLHSRSTLELLHWKVRRTNLNPSPRTAQQTYLSMFDLVPHIPRSTCDLIGHTESHEIGTKWPESRLMHSFCRYKLEFFKMQNQQCVEISEQRVLYPIRN